MKNSDLDLCYFMMVQTSNIIKIGAAWTIYPHKNKSTCEKKLLNFLYGQYLLGYWGQSFYPQVKKIYDIGWSIRNGNEDRYMFAYDDISEEESQLIIDYLLNERGIKLSKLRALPRVVRPKK